jgi:pimeloyl-ACP methyl ester carboxylesterase
MTASQNLKVNWKTVPTRTITAGGVEFAYGELGTNNPGTPVVFLIHLAAVLGNWDPRVVDGFAATRRVITFDNRGVGASSGTPATSIEQMATDAIAFIKAMGFEQVDLFGFSMGGMIAQEIVLAEPQLVRKMIIAGTVELTMRTEDESGLSTRDLDRRVVRIAAIGCGTHDPRENGLV